MFIIIASCVISLGLEVEASRRVKVGKSSLGGKERFNYSKISELRSGSVMDLRVRDCESKISRILLMVESHVHVITCVCVEFRDEILFKGGGM